MFKKLFNRPYENREYPEPSTVVVYLMIAFEMLFESCAVMFLWMWFIVPLGAPSINVIHALGIDLLVTLVAQPRVDENESFIMRFVNNIVFASLSLIIGFIAHFFV